MKYQYITDLPENWNSLLSGRLGALASVWRDQAVKMQNNKTYQAFNEKLYRRWAIETGIIENLYDIDRGTTEVLVEQGFAENLLTHGSTNKSPQFVIETLQTHREAIEFLFDFVKNKRTLSDSYIKELHSLLASTQNTTSGKDPQGHFVRIALKKGQWKTLPNNPTRSDGETHEYCPPEHVQSEIDRLLIWHNEHLNNSVPPAIEAAWIHHRFTQIHPFQDGNGRVARAIASLVLIKDGLFPFIVPRDERSIYIDALEEADNGNLAPLIHMVEKFQQNEIKKALSLVADVESEKAQEDLLESIGRKIASRKQERFDTILNKSIQLSQELQRTTGNKLDEISTQLNDIFKNNNIDSDFIAFSASNHTGNDYWYKNQIVHIAKDKEYFADTRTHRAWSRLAIKDGLEFNVIFSFHSLGYDFSGTMCVSGFSFEKIKEDTDEKASPPIAISDDIFIFTHEDGLELLLKRFCEWLDHAILVALAQFKEQV